MRNQILPILALSLVFSGCGKKSEIKNNVEAEKLSCAYGDCKHIIRNVTFPLDNSALAFKTPLPGLGPIAGGLIKFMGDVFAKNTKMGRVELSYTQTIPQIPQELHSVRLKRFFFYMKPKKAGGLTTEERGPVEESIRRYVFGEGKSTFDFIDKFALRISAANIDTPDKYKPVLVEDLGSDSEELLKVFKKKNSTEVVDTEVARKLILLKYHKKTRQEDSANKLYGKIHYLETSKSAPKMKEFFLQQLELKGHYKRILLLDNALLIELHKDPVSSEVFKTVMINNAEKLDQELGLSFIDTCTRKSCLELKVPDVNLVPIAYKGNALKLEALLHPDTVPDSFKLKGFVEFEVKFESEI